MMLVVIKSFLGSVWTLLCSDCVVVVLGIETIVEGALIDCVMVVLGISDPLHDLVFEC